VNSLREITFATALAVLAAAMHLLFSLAVLISPNMFRLLFNAQFFGADTWRPVIPYEPTLVQIGVESG
jgi:hypothetical protein